MELAASKTVALKLGICHCQQQHLYKLLCWIACCISGGQGLKVVQYYLLYGLYDFVLMKIKLVSGIKQGNFS